MVKNKRHKNRTVYIYPANNNENQFVNIQERSIRACGFDVTYSFKDFFRAEFFVLNWFETLGKKVYVDYVKKVFKLFVFVTFRKKVLWLVHNKKPHVKSSEDKSENLSIQLMKKLLRISTKIIILCDETKSVFHSLCPDVKIYEGKVYKIPHPNYIGVYECLNETNPHKDKLNFLYFGQINEYKNVDLLVKAFNTIRRNDVFLTVAGNCKNKEYALRLNSIKENENIQYDFKFVPDDEICWYMDNCDVVVLPYSTESVLNSGSIFLAFSYKKTVLCPLIGTLKEYRDESFFYTYEYSDANDHLKELKEAINKIVCDWDKDHECLTMKGNDAFEDVKVRNSFDNVTIAWKNLFREFR